VRRPRKNPLADPVAHVKQPLRSGKTPGRRVIEFDPLSVTRIRSKFGATQKEFARLIGISRETLRNWESGRRRPVGPSRALLRAIDANPFVLARVLNWHAEQPIEAPEDLLDDET
jgi:putative transcriptional regulator